MKRILVVRKKKFLVLDLPYLEIAKSFKGRIRKKMLDRNGGI